MKRNLRRTLSAVVCSGLVLAAAAVVSSSPATASQPSDPGPANALPNAVPSAITPAVNNGSVQAIAQVGNTMVIGGDFTQVGGQTRNHVAAFNASSGALSSFAPNVDGEVKAVLPGPTSTTAYIGGTFTHVNGTAAQFIAVVDLGTGNLDSSFHPPAFNFGYVNDMVMRGNRLYVGGTFTKAGGKAHGGLVSLNATTGALDPFMNVQLTDRHNDSGSGAQGWIGPWDLDVTPDGKTMVVIGDFKHADGLLRDQIAMIDLTGSSAQVTNWATDGYAPYCFSWAFDGYVRGVSFSPDGSYFVVNATGGGNPGTLCDAVSRFDTDPNNANAEPTWVDQTGGDTVWGVTVTNSIVYVGGHNRWLNNPLGVDRAQPGAVPRGGLAALNPANGRPYLWNPGRRPLGAAVYAMLATSTGLWIGSDTDWIGNRTYKRPKIAFFPYSGGYTPASTSTAGLPGTVYLGGSKGTGQSNVLYRVDAGGPLIQALDSGPDWAADTSDPSPYRNNGSNAAGYSPGATINSSVPSTTPSAIFDSERWSPSDNPAMQWAFPATAGTHLQVRLYFANRCTCTENVGDRRFDVRLDGSTVLNNYDIVGDVGDQTGTMKAFNITSDGTVNIDFSHEKENPLVNGIEIVNTDLPTPPPGSQDGLNTVAFDGTTATAGAADNQGIDFGNWRGAFMVGNTVFYGYVDGNLYSRSFDGATFGSAAKIDPYNDPYWSDIDTDDGTTFRGMVPTLYGQMSNVTGMAYSNGRLYYTLFGSANLFSRWFSTDSGILDETTRTETSSVNFSNADGMFISGGKLYYASSDGNLSSVAFNGGTVSGSPTVLSGPGIDGVSWKNRALFLASAAPVNSPPTAAFTSSCAGLVCTFDASGSHDSDGTVSSYSWDVGDGSSAESGVNPSHTYAAGSYHVTLTVTDNDGATATATHDVNPVAVSTNIAFVGAVDDSGGAVRTRQVTMPGGAAAGDTAVLVLAQSTTDPWTGPSGVTGWSEVGTFANSSLTTTVWTRALTTGDLNGSVKFTDPGYDHASLSLAVYSGVDASTPVQAFAQSLDTGKTSHASPAVTAADGDYVMTIWTGRAQAAQAWTTPAAATVRDASTDSGTVTLQAVVADSGGPVAAGSYGGLTASTAVKTDRSVTWTLALNSDSGSGNQPPPDTDIAFVGAVDDSGGAVRTRQVTMPGGAAAGDTAVLVLAQSTTDPWTGPSGVTGWSEVGTFANSSLTTTVWTRALTTGDLNGSVKFTDPGYDHASLSLAVYSGVDASTPVQAFAQSLDTGKTSHASPAVTAADGDYVMTIWTGRAQAAQAWTTPAAATVRDASTDSGTVTLQAVVADSGGPVAAGSYGGLTASTAVKTDRSVTWTLALNSA